MITLIQTLCVAHRAIITSFGLQTFPDRHEIATRVEAFALETAIADIEPSSMSEKNVSTVSVVLVIDS